MMQKFVDEKRLNEKERKINTQQQQTNFDRNVFEHTEQVRCQISKCLVTYSANFISHTHPSLLFPLISSLVIAPLLNSLFAFDSKTE